METELQKLIRRQAVARTEDDDIELQDALQESQRIKEIKEQESASTPAMI